MESPAPTQFLPTTESAPDAKAATPPITLPEEFVPLKFIGGGAMAELWQVRDRERDETVALKILKPDRPDFAVTRRILENEAEVGSAVRSPYVVQLLDANLEHDPPFLVHEWLDGATLEEMLRERERLPYHEAIWIARQSAAGLEDLRQAGYTHGDVKPANIIIQPDGRLKLIDLGFARRCRRADGDQTAALDVITGTPEYLAPEALSAGLAWGVARDIYSLGVTLFRMLAGRLPFLDEEPADLLRRQLGTAAPHVRQFAPEVPRELDELLCAMLAKQPIRRPESLKRLIRGFVELELSTISSAA